MLDLDKVLESIEESEEKKAENRERKTDERFLSVEPGETCIVRLLPYLKSPGDTFVDYEEYGWPSVLPNGGYIYAGRTPKSVKRPDPVANAQWALFSEGRDNKDEAKKTRSYKLFPQFKQMVNVYVVKDSKNPENNGTVKILRYSSRLDKNGIATGHLHKVITSALFGDDKAEVGKKAFDLGNGCSLRIKVFKNAGDWPDYSESKFLFPDDLGLSDAEKKEIYEQVYDLNEFIPEVKSESELKQLLDEHWFGVNASSDSSVIEDDYEDDNLPGLNTEEAEEDMDDFLKGIV